MLFCALFDAVIFEIVIGKPELTNVMKTIKMDITMLYKPSASVEINRDKYILYINPKNLEITENNVSIITALNNFLIISPQNVLVNCIKKFLNIL